MGADVTALETIKVTHLGADELPARGHNPTRRYGPQWDYRCPPSGHEDSTPSLKVHLGRSTWRCYGCDQGGSVIDLMMLLDEVDVKEAIRRLGGTPAKTGRRKN